MNKFAERLTSLLKEQDILQNQLAEHLNVKQQTISKYIYGISEPCLDTVIKIAKFFDVTTDYLLGLED